MANPILATGAIGKPEQIASLWRKGCCRVWTCEKEFHRGHGCADS